MSDRREGPFIAGQGYSLAGAGTAPWLNPARVGSRYIQVDLIRADAGFVYVRWLPGRMPDPLALLPQQLSPNDYQAVAWQGSRPVFDMGSELKRDIQISSPQPNSGFLAHVSMDVEPINDSPLDFPFPLPSTVLTLPGTRYPLPVDIGTPPLKQHVNIMDPVTKGRLNLGPLQTKVVLLHGPPLALNTIILHNGWLMAVTVGGSTGTVTLSDTFAIPGVYAVWDAASASTSPIVWGGVSLRASQDLLITNNDAVNPITVLGGITYTTDPTR